MPVTYKIESVLNKHLCVFKWRVCYNVSIENRLLLKEVNTRCAISTIDKVG
ncbi:MAG: hypothetical protein J6Y20_11530 [Lachnospiraceae bacterium]|nr:hypothetical protein [Lachnospiraceae bacterium]